MKNNLTPLLGSYPQEDCLFLLKEIEEEFTSIEDKEYLIQSNKAHYSETISKEDKPTEEYTNLFYLMNNKYKNRLASEVMLLADIMIHERAGFGSADDPIVLLSLARAGTPIGVMLKKALEIKGVSSVHFSISIIRDKGIDATALEYVRERYSEQAICFIDGWTAKGVITEELHASVTDFNEAKGANVPKELFVVSDAGGSADFCATYGDYTIPSALMNSTISGLISRSILNEKTKSGFHGCIRYGHLEKYDLSNWFIDQVVNEMKDSESINKEVASKSEIKQKATTFINAIKEEFNVKNINHIKPGIAEATRVMLRRVPDIIILKSKTDPDVQHLVQIAKEKDIKIILDFPDMPFGACALIKEVL